MSLIGYTFRSRARPISSTPPNSRGKVRQFPLAMAIRPNPTRRCLENPALGSMPGNLSSTSSFLLLPFLRLSSPSAFRVSSARYCRYFQTQHEQPASAMDETMPRDTRRMMEEEERERKTEAYDC